MPKPIWPRPMKPTARVPAVIGRPTRISTSSMASRLGPSIMKARVSAERIGCSRMVDALAAQLGDPGVEVADAEARLS